MIFRPHPQSLAILILCLTWATGLLPAHADTKDAWIDLFNGTDTAGWKNNNGTPVKTRVEDGTLNPYRSGGYILVYDQKFGDFILQCDVKMDGRSCNSGIFVRIGDLNDPVQTGLEIQIAGGPGTSRHSFGALYDLVAPSENASHGPGKWDSIEIRCQGPVVTVTVNGKQVTKMDCDQFDRPGFCPDGTPNKYQQAVKDFPRTGYLGFQDHGHNVWYKNVRIRKLNDGT